MGTHTTFDEILDAVDHLPVDEQAELVDVIRRHLADQGRKQIVADVRGRGPVQRWVIRRPTAPRE